MTADADGDPVPDPIPEWQPRDADPDERCPACDLHLELRAHLGADRTDDAVAAVDRLISGTVRPCVESLPWIAALGVEPLLDVGRDAHAGELFRLALRTARQQRNVPVRARLADLAARTGDQRGARRIAGPLHDRLADLEPRPRLHATAHLARAAVDDPATGRRLAERAASLAADIDTALEKPVAADRVNAIVTAPDRRPVPLRLPAAPIESDPDLVLDGIEPLDFPQPPPPAADASEAPTDAGGLAFHRWAFDRMDGWRSDLVRTAAEPIWFDPNLDLSVRAAAGLWLAASGRGPAPDDIEIVLDAGGDDIPAPIRAALLVEAARGHADDDRDRARSLTARALRLIDDGELGNRDAVSIARSAAVGLAAIRDADGVLAALHLVRRHDPGPDSGEIASVLAALSAVEIAERGYSEQPDEDRDRRLRTALDRVGAAAAAVLERRSDPAAAHALVQTARRELQLGEAESALERLHLAIGAIPTGPATAAMRTDLHLVQADAMVRLGGVEAGLPAQRAAIEAALENGSDRLIGWARRGLAHQLAALDRPDDARTQALAALRHLTAADGRGIEIVRLQLAAARACARTGRDQEAGDHAEDALHGLDRLDPRPDGADELLAQALDVAAEAALADADLETAEAHLVRLADHLAAKGQPAVLARANAARTAARAGRADRSDELFERAETDLDEIRRRAQTGETELRRLEVVLRSRRAEAEWALGRDEAAIEWADRARELGADLDDRLLDTRLVALIARARHDRLRRIIADHPERTAELLPEVEDALVDAVQRSHAIDDTAAAEELGRRLEAVRELDG